VPFSLRFFSQHLRQVQVVPADDPVPDQTIAAVRHLLLGLLCILSPSLQAKRLSTNDGWTLKNQKLPEKNCGRKYQPVKMLPIRRGKKCVTGVTVNRNWQD
jgi:hypothetical protein